MVYLVYMGRRGRQRAELERSQAREPRDRMARVQASDETWAAFRAQLGVTPVSVALGRLVEREVARTARSSASDAEGVRVALEDARAVAGELAALIARPSRSPVRTGRAKAPAEPPLVRRAASRHTLWLVWRRPIDSF